MIGKRVLHYRIVEKLGEGGMGVVYRAEDTKLHRDVALKFLPDEALEREEDRRRFFAEARSAAALDHPSICTVHEINEVDGHHFIAMAYVEGHDLKEIVERDGPMKILDAVRAGVQIAQGLAAAHDKGIVHRDIKSANIMVTPKGRVQIMDFGLAHHAHGARADTPITSGGTIAYASPEQANGENVDHRGDIWSFGVTLYEMVTGRLPFGGDYESAVVYSILNETPVPPSSLRPGVPAELDRIIIKALSKTPGERYQSVEEMREDLTHLGHEIDPTVSKVGSTVTRAPQPLQRVVITVGAYLAAAWIAAWIVRLVVGNMQLSPHLVTMASVGLLSLLPAVVIVAYSTAQRGRRRWGRPESIGVGANIVLVAALLHVLFSGKDLGAAMQRVEVTNEEGEKIERVMPKGNFRTSFAMYPFENRSGDANVEWLQYAIPLLVEYDVYQDAFINARSALEPSTFERVKESGFKSWAGVPLALKRKIASEFHQNRFVTGTVDEEGGEYVVAVQVHETDSGRLVQERTYRGSDIFSLADEISVDVKHAAGVPQWHLDGVRDMPVADMVTNSEEAVREFALARKSIAVDEDWSQAVAHLEAATAIDSTLSFAHFYKFLAYRVTNDNRADQALESALRHAYKVPERFQFIIKGNYYFMTQEPDKALALFKMATELYPDDVQGYEALAQLHIYRNDLDAAIADYERMLELDPYQYDNLHALGELARRKGYYEKALEYHQRYAELNPQDPTSFQQIADVYARMGEFEKAKENYEKALLIEPQRVSLMVGAANIERSMGHFDEALEQYHAALRASNSSTDSSRALSAIEGYYEMRGEFRQAIRFMEMRFASMTTPLVVYIQRLDDVDRYVYAGRTDEAFAIMEETKRVLTSPPPSKVVPYGYVQIYDALQDADELERAADGFEEYVSTYGLEVLRDEVDYARARVHELRGEYEDAIATYEKIVARTPGSTEMYRGLGRCQRESNDYASAEKNLLAGCKLAPFDPETNYELALLYHATGNGAKANEHLQRTLAVWQNADPEYRPAARARATQAEWAAAASM